MTVAFIVIEHLSTGRIWVSRRESGAAQGIKEEIKEIKEVMPTGGIGNIRHEE